MSDGPCDSYRPHIPLAIDSDDRQVGYIQGLIVKRFFLTVVLDLELDHSSYHSSQKTVSYGTGTSVFLLSLFMCLWTILLVSPDFI